MRLAPAPGGAVDRPAEWAVFFDGACPLCRREIAHYRALAARSQAPLRFVDVSAEPLPDGAPDRAALLARLHVHGNGRWQHGAAAFVAVWAQLPGWRWAARLARLPGVLPVLEGAYRLFLTLRPLWRPAPACASATCSPRDPR